MPPLSVTAVLLDAFGTLLRLDPPAPALAGRLAADGHRHSEEAVAAAIAAEIRHYRRHHDRGRDAASLARLRRDCARVVADHLGPDVPPLERLTEHLVASLRFQLMPDALPALDALAHAGLRLGIVSNWDCSLPDVLDTLGVLDRFGVVAVSAVVGAAKPDRRIFAAALAGLGVPPEGALHCGDRAEYDGAGARAAGVRAVIVDRDGDAGADADGWPRIRSLTDLPALAGA